MVFRCNPLDFGIEPSTKASMCRQLDINHQPIKTSLLPQASRDFLCVLGRIEPSVKANPDACVLVENN